MQVDRWSIFIGLVFFTKGLPIWRHILGLLGWSIPILEIKLCNRSPRRCENKEILGIIERVWSLKIRQWLEANRHPINLFWNQKNSAKPTSFDQEKSCLTSGSAQLTWDLCVKKGGSNSKYRRLKRIGDPNLGLKTLPETNSSHLKMDGWNLILSFWVPADFQGLSFRECNRGFVCCNPKSRFLVNQMGFGGA